MGEGRGGGGAAVVLAVSVLAAWLSKVLRSSPRSLPWQHCGR
ncbi:hypothetical protein [Streptomyces sp. NPDC058726]